MKVESEGLFVGPDDGQALSNPVGGRMLVKLREDDTGGSYSVHENVIPPGLPAPCPTSTTSTRRPSTSSKGS
jgi:hypothetical protein